MNIVMQFLSFAAIALLPTLLSAQANKPPDIVADTVPSPVLAQDYIRNSAGQPIEAGHYFYVKNIGGDGTVDADITVDTYKLKMQLAVRGNSTDTCHYLSS